MKYLLTILLCLWSIPAFSAINVFQHKGFGSSIANNSISVTFNPTGANDLIVVSLNIGGSPFISTMKDSSGNSYTQFPSASYPSNQNYTYYIPHSTLGTTSITATFTGTDSGKSEIEMWEVSGFFNAVPDVGNATITGVQSGGVATGLSLTTSGNYGFIVAADTTNGTVTGNPAGGNAFTSGGDILDGEGFVSLVTSSTGTYNPAWTDSGSAFQNWEGAFMDNTTTAIQNATIRNANIN